MFLLHARFSSRIVGSVILEPEGYSEPHERGKIHGEFGLMGNGNASGGDDTSDCYVDSRISDVTSIK